MKMTTDFALQILKEIAAKRGCEISLNEKNSQDIEGNNPGRLNVTLSLRIPGHPQNTTVAKLSSTIQFNLSPDGEFLELVDIFDRRLQETLEFTDRAVKDIKVKLGIKEQGE